MWKTTRLDLGAGCRGTGCSLLVALLIVGLPGPILAQESHPVPNADRPAPPLGSDWVLVTGRVVAPAGFPVQLEPVRATSPSIDLAEASGFVERSAQVATDGRWAMPLPRRCWSIVWGDGPSDVRTQPAEVDLTNSASGECVDAGPLVVPPGVLAVIVRDRAGEPVSNAAVGVLNPGGLLPLFAIFGDFDGFGTSTARDGHLFLPGPSEGGRIGAFRPGSNFVEAKPSIPVTVIEFDLERRVELQLPWLAESPRRTDGRRIDYVLDLLDPERRPLFGRVDLTYDCRDHDTRPVSCIVSLRPGVYVVKVFMRVAPRPGLSSLKAMPSVATVRSMRIEVPDTKSEVSITVPVTDDDLDAAIANATRK